MESFAQRYCQLNPDLFTNSDTCYVLSFAVIMLNTSLHNPSVKDKPGVDQFVSMNRGINDGGDLPRELLVSLYDSIKTEPFKVIMLLIAGYLDVWLHFPPGLVERYVSPARKYSYILFFIRSQKMMGTTLCIPFSILIVRAGCGNKEEDIKAGREDGLY